MYQKRTPSKQAVPLINKLADSIGDNPLVWTVFLAAINTALCAAFLRFMLVVHDAGSTFFTTDQSPDNAILFLLAIIYGVDFSNKYGVSVQARATLEDMDSLFCIWFSKKTTRQLSSKPYADLLAVIETNSSWILDNNLMFLIMNKVAAGAQAKSIFYFKEDNKLRWYILLLVIILHTFISPLYLIGALDTPHIVMNCAMRSLISHFLICILFHISRCAEIMSKEPLEFSRKLYELSKKDTSKMSFYTTYLGPMTDAAV